MRRTSPSTSHSLSAQRSAMRIRSSAPASSSSASQVCRLRFTAQQTRSYADYNQSNNKVKITSSAPFAKSAPKPASFTTAARKLGVGTARLSLKDSHLNLLQSAIESGLTFVDTAATYPSEKLLGRLIKEKRVNRDDLTIVSKFGYVTGYDLELSLKGELPDVPDEQIIKQSSRFHHSIHAAYIDRCIQESLRQLNTDRIDLYLIYNPDAYFHNLTRQDEQNQQKVIKLRAALLRRIFLAFISLEEKVAQGKIKAYGISSPGLALDNVDVHYLPFKELINLANKAAQAWGHTKHSFTTVQFPANILEPRGLDSCGLWAKEHGLDVITTRSLDAYDLLTRHRRLVSPWKSLYNYNDSLLKTRSYFEEKLKISHIPPRVRRGRVSGKEEEPEVEPPHPASIIIEIINDVDAKQKAMSSNVQFDDYLYTNVLPNLTLDILNFFGAPDKAILLDYFEAVKEDLKLRNTGKTLSWLREEGIMKAEDGTDVEKKALDYLLNHQLVDRALVGLTHPNHLDYLKSYMRKFEESQSAQELPAKKTDQTWQIPGSPYSWYPKQAKTTTAATQ